MIRIRTAAVALFLCTLGAQAALSQSQPVQIRLANGTFLYDEELSLLEVYLSFGAQSLTYTAMEDGSHLARVPVRIRVQASSTGSAGETRPAPVFEEQNELHFVVQNPELLSDGQVFVEQIRTAVPPGEYEIVATVFGPEGADWNEFDVVSDVTVPAYGTASATSISAIQLATRIQRAESRDGQFVKSGLDVVPNPDAFYGGALGSVPFYVEVYQPAPETEAYTLLLYLSETNQPTPISETQRRLERQVRPVDVIAETIDVSALPSGVYFLRIVALNEANEAIAEQSKRFFVINPDVTRPGDNVAELNYEESLYAVMGEEELDQNLQHARILATSREQDRLGQLGTDDEKRAFLVAFWVNRKTDPRPSGNDARRVFYERLNVANSQYSQAGQEGFETDRGRVYIRYGPPTEVDRHFVEADTLPYEIWIYDNIPGEGRSTFVFADRFRISRLELIHSDVTGEVSLPNWLYTLRSN